MRIECPRCGEPLTVSARQEGRRVTCPECGERFRAREESETDYRDREPTVVVERGGGLGSGIGLGCGLMIGLTVASLAILVLVVALCAGGCGAVIKNMPPPDKAAPRKAAPATPAK